MIAETGSVKMFKDAVGFSHFVETSALANNQTCSDAIIEYCENRALEPEAIAKLITRALKGKLQVELIELGLLPEIGTLEDL